MKVFSFLFSHFRLFYKKRLRYALPFLILILYTVFGAYIFRYFELEADEQRRAHYRANAEYAFKRTLSRMLEVRCEEGLDEAGQSLQARHVKEHLFWLVDYLNLTKVIEERSESSPWTWVGAMFYAGQLYTTIGYGIPITQTSGGRLASIAYIMVGIPLFLIILTEIGRLLSRGLRKLYKKVHAARKKLPEASRKMSEPMRAIYNMTAAMAGTAVGSAATPMINGAVRGELLLAEETRRKEAERRDAQKALEKLKKEGQKEEERGGEQPQQFPIPWALIILIMWTMLSAAMFCIWETEWGYMTSIYFFFVSISTVGLGDLVPTNPDMMIVNFFMILIGLALLSMCIDLIQKALQKLIERLIEQYIDEIEKMASEVTNVEDEEEAAEDIPPLLPETAAVLTEGESRRGSRARRKSSTIGRVKDWIAERASNFLVNKIYPEESSESETVSDEEDEPKKRELTAEDEPELEAVVVERKPLLDRPAEAWGRPRGLAQGTEPEGVAEAMELLLVDRDRRVSFGSSSIMPSQQSSMGKRRPKKVPKVPKNYAGALLRYDPTKIKAIQARELAKMHREGGSADFRARLFAKFSANKRFAQIVESNQPTQMVSSSIQTSPVQSPIQSRRTWRLRRIGCGVESMDSTSTSEVNGGLTTSRTENNSCSANDLDSLYSNTYFDLRFGGFSTDSVPHLMAQQNTPQVLSFPAGMQSYEARRKFSAKLFGLFGRILPRGDENGREGEERQQWRRRDDETEGEAAGRGGQQQAPPGQERKHQPRSSRPRSKCHSTPSSPPMSRDHHRRNGSQQNNEESDPSSLPTTPLILITDPTTTELRHLSLTPQSTPVHGSNSNLQDNRSDIHTTAQRKRTASAHCASPSLGSVPLYHRHLARRRRFSAIPSFKRAESLSALNERWRELRRTNMASIGRTMRSMDSNEGEDVQGGGRR